MSGWKFDNLHITVWQRLCEALYVAGRRKDAAESLLEMVYSFDKEVYTSELITKWVSGGLILYPLATHSNFSADFTHQCLSAPECDGGAVSTSTEDTYAVTVLATPAPLLREWAKATLAHYSWKDALLSANDVSITFCSRVYPWP